jgi:CRP-like cAMP-binding protein
LEVIFLEGDHSNGKMYIVVTGAVAIAIKKSLNVFEKENEDMIT